MKLFWIMLLAWNIVVLFIYGADKLFARRGRRRIRESTLLLVAFCLGSVGAMFGMVLFHHKTAKPKFRFGVPFAVLCNIAAIVAGYYFLFMQ